MIESREGPETCNTYNMLRLTERLFRAEPSARVRRLLRARALQSHPLDASIRCTAASCTSRRFGRGTIASTRSRPNASGAASAPAWRITASTASSSTPTRGDELFVNLFIASALRWPERGLELRQETGFPDEARTRLVLVAAAARALHAARPPPVMGGGGRALRIRVNGQAVARRLDAVLLCRRSRASGTTATVWRSTCRCDDDRAAAGRLGLCRDPARPDRARGQDRDRASSTGSSRATAAWRTSRRVPICRSTARRCWSATRPRSPDHIRPVAGSPMTFTASDLIRPAEARDLELVPFFRVHDSRYMIYWRAVAPSDYPKVVARARGRRDEAAAGARAAHAGPRHAGRAAAGGRAQGAGRRRHDWRHERPHAGARPAAGSVTS